MSTTTDIDIELPVADKIKVFEQSDELVDFFAAPSPSINKNNTDDSNKLKLTVGVVSKKSTQPKSTINQFNVAQKTSTIDSNATFVKVGPSPFDHDSSDEEDEETPPTKIPSDCWSVFRADVRAVLSVGGDDGLRCGKYCSGARIYNVVSFMINIFAVTVEILKK